MPQFHLFFGRMRLKLVTPIVTVRTMFSSRPKLLREQDDVEGICLRRREADSTNPRIPAVGADVFGFFILCCIGDLVLASRLACQAPTHIMR